MYLVTGATGFLGSHLVCQLLLAGYEVKAVKRADSRMDEFNYICSLYPKVWPDNAKLQWVVADIEDIFSLDEALEDVIAVFHAAAVVSFRKADADKLFKTNVEGTANLLNCCLKKGNIKFYHISSTAAIGSSEPNIASDENTEWKLTGQTSNYSLSKHAAEMEVWRAAEEGLQVCVVNPAIIIGEGWWKRGTCRFFYNALNNFPFYACGSNAFVDVKDVCRALIWLHQKEIYGERFLVHGHNRSFESLFMLMAEKLSRRKPFIKITPFRAQLAWRLFAFVSFITGKKSLITKESALSSVSHKMYSSEKLKSVGFEFTSFENTIERTCNNLLLCNFNK